MTKKSFYLTLNILNVLLWVIKATSLFCIIVIYADIIETIIPKYVMLSFIFCEIFFLYILFAIFEKYFPNSIFNKIKIELKTCNRNKIYALLLAFCYDFIIFFGPLMFPNFLNRYFIEILILITLFWQYLLGGILMFYLSTFVLWKIEDKIKSFYNKKLLNDKSAK